MGYYFGSGSTICGRIHTATLLDARYCSLNHYSIPSTICQSDGQMEWVNQELEQYLRVFVNERQDDWDRLLPMAEFQYNNHVHSSTQQTPCLLDTGRHPHMGFEPSQLSQLETVKEFTDRMQSSLTEAKAALKKAQEDMAKYYDRRREPAPQFSPGDK